MFKRVFAKRLYSLSVAVFFLCDGIALAENSEADTSTTPPSKGLCEKDLIAVGLSLTEPAAIFFKGMRIEKTRVLPTALMVNRDWVNRGEKSLFTWSAEKKKALDNLADQEFDAWRDAAYARTDLPILILDEVPKEIGPAWTPDSVQLVTIKGDKKVYRPVAKKNAPDAEPDLKDFYCAKSQATYSNGMLAKFLFQNTNRVPRAQLVRYRDEVGVLSDFINGDATESPNLVREELRNLDPRGFDDMTDFSFLTNNGDLFWGRVEISGKLTEKPGWRGIFLVDGKYTVVFDFNISAKPGFSTHTEESLMGTRLPETHSASLLQQMSLLNMELLRSFGFTTRDSRWMLFYRDIILKDHFLRHGK